MLGNYLADDAAAIDQTVPYVSAAQTLQAMLALGAPDVTLTDCAALPFSHIGCVPDFPQFMLGEFARRARDL